MPTPVAQKHYGRLYLTDGAFVSASASNLLAYADVSFSDILTEAGGVRSDTFETTSPLVVVSDRYVNLTSIVMTIASNTTVLNDVKLSMDLDVRY
jgi:hypothetical protein